MDGKDESTSMKIILILSSKNSSKEYVRKENNKLLSFANFGGKSKIKFLQTESSSM